MLESLRMNNTEPRGYESDSVEEIEVTVLMPCLDESETIERCITKAMRFLSENGIRGEIIVADNGSSDGSPALAESLGARVVHVPRRGYGAALIRGIQAARGRYTVMGDSDDSYDFSHLMPFLEHLRSGADLVMGNRFSGDMAPGAMPWLHRYIGNPLLSFVGRLFFNIPIRDFHCGLRAFNTYSVRKLGLKTNGMEFASEMVVRSAFAGFTIKEVPIPFAVDGRSRSPHLRTWHDGWRHLKFLLIYSPRWLFLLPGTAMIAIGMILVTALILGPLPLSNNLILDLNTFIGACFLVVLGIQFLTFGAIARVFAARAGFLPRGPRTDLLFRWVSTDRLVQIAAVLFAIGLVGIAWASWQWMQTGFGPLYSPSVPRIMVSALCAIVIAIQTIGAAFLWGIIEIPLDDAGQNSDQDVGAVHKMK